MSNSPSPPKRYVIERFARSVFHREEHGIDFAKTTYQNLPTPVYVKLGGGETENLQEAQAFGWVRRPVFNPKIERLVPIELRRVDASE